MRELAIFTFMTLMVSCHGVKDNMTSNFVSRIEAVGLDKFKNIEYGTQGKIESYHYCLTNDSFVAWKYNMEKERFELPFDLKQLKKLPYDYKAYVIDLRSRIQSLNVVMITQVPWRGDFMKFWISTEEIIAYVNTKFKFDDKFKNEWLSDLNAGEKIKENWYYINLKK